ncbi:MAG: hypothetical protein U0694_08100 [Anaerolineae bacterium]
MTTPPDTQEPYVSEEEAEHRTNREAFFLISGGFLIFCAPSMLCYWQYSLVAFWILLMVLSMLSALGTLLFWLATGDLVSRLGLRKRKRFIPGDELTIKNE